MVMQRYRKAARKKSVTVNLTDKEFIALVKESHLAQLTMSDYIRSMVLPTIMDWDNLDPLGVNPDDYETNRATITKTKR